MIAINILIKDHINTFLNSLWMYRLNCSLAIISTVFFRVRLFKKDSKHFLESFGETFSENGGKNLVSNDVTNNSAIEGERVLRSSPRSPKICTI